MSKQQKPKSAAPDISRTRLERICELDRLIRAEEYPNCTSFARHWARKIGSDILPDRKTIFRDIDWLRDMLGAPIEWNAREKGYHYTAPSWTMPLLRLAEGELVALLLARQMGKVYRNTPMAKQLDSLFKKIAATLPQPAMIDPLHFGSLFSFHARPAREVSPEIWRAIFSAIRGSRVLRIAYRGRMHPDAEWREVEPVHLANVDDDWYLLAHCRRRDDWRHFALSRMEQATTRETRFTPRTDFDPDAYFANRFGKFVAPKQEKTLLVRLRFAPRAAAAVRERIWHPKQKIQERADGSLILTLPIPSLAEARRFCFGWGSAAEVLAPQSLRRQMAEDVRLLHRMYSSRMTDEA